MNNYENDQLPTAITAHTATPATSSAAWSNIRLIHGASVRPGAGVKIGMIDDGIDLNPSRTCRCAAVTEYFFGDAHKGIIPLPMASAKMNNKVLTRHRCRQQYSYLTDRWTTNHFLNFYGNANAAHLHAFTLKRINSSSIED